MAQHYIVGFGSLMSHQSRKKYSGIDSQAIAVSVSGWQRGWISSCQIEGFTSLGAYQSTNSLLNAMLIPIPAIDETLRKREKNHHFVAISLESIDVHGKQPDLNTFSADGDDKFWICEAKQKSQAVKDFPIFQSYVDTCFAGCLESASLQFAKEFIDSTHGWEGHWINDRAEPRYPRAADVTEKMQVRIDSLLEAANVLQHRKPAI